MAFIVEVFILLFYIYTDANKIAYFVYVPQPWWNFPLNFLITLNRKPLVLSTLIPCSMLSMYVIIEYNIDTYQI